MYTCTCTCIAFLCVDVDECLVNNGGCAGTCSNSDGSFMCGCSSGYTVGSDGLNCEGIATCMSWVYVLHNL